MELKHPVFAVETFPSAHEFSFRVARAAMVAMSLLKNVFSPIGPEKKIPWKMGLEVKITIGSPTYLGQTAI